MKNKELKEKLRVLFSNYVTSEGHSCCELQPQHNNNLEKICELLDIPKYEDNSGYDTYKYSEI